MAGPGRHSPDHELVVIRKKGVVPRIFQTQTGEIVFPFNRIRSLRELVLVLHTDSTGQTSLTKWNRVQASHLVSTDWRDII